MIRKTVFVISFLFLCACSSEDDTTDGGLNATFNATIGDVSFSRDNASVTILQDVLTIEAAVPAPFQNIELRIENVSEGSFTLGQSVNRFVPQAIYRDQNRTYITDLNNGSGQLTITDLDITNMRISGSFTFTARALDGSENITVSNGRFENLDIDTYAPDIPESENRLEANIGTTPHRSDTVIAGDSGAPTGFISIRSLNNFTGQEITLSIQEGLGVGTYAFDADPMAAVQADYNFFNTPDAITPLNFKAVSGVLQINSMDMTTGRMSGVFNCQVLDPNGESPLLFEINGGAFEAIIPN